MKRKARFIRTKFILGISFLFLLVTVAGFFLPQELIMPVKGAGEKDYDKRSFWYYPWGRSGTHKGVDIFAKKGTDILSATYGVVIYKGKLGRGGNVICVLGPKWRIHYYAHLEEIKASRFDWVGKGTEIGTVGNTGNAKGKPPHLHYSIITIIPYPWRADLSPQGHKKMYYLNPIEYLEKRNLQEGGKTSVTAQRNNRSAG